MQLSISLKDLLLLNSSLEELHSRLLLITFCSEVTGAMGKLVDVSYLNYVMPLTQFPIVFYQKHSFHQIHKIQTG